MDEPENRFIQPGRILRPYPSAEDVFVPEQVDLVRHLHPLVSIDLSAANPAWSGWAHILSPLEPFEALPFMFGEDFHNDFMKTNALVLHLEDGRYRFRGDRRSFLLEQQPSSLTDERRIAFATMTAHYETTEASYRRAAEAYRTYGKLHFLDEAGAVSQSNDEPQPLLDQLGGTAQDSNWTGCLPFDVETAGKYGDPEGHAVWPLSPAGRRFELVASTPGWLYRRNGADSILLFYEPVEKLVLLTFDWT